MNKPLVFVSYSHKDEEEKDRLLTHLGVLRSSLIEIWSDDQLVAGDEWGVELSRVIESAQVAILLVTANFLTSKFILQEEVPRLLQRRKKEGLIVFPVIAKPCPWEVIDWLTRMQVRPKNANPVWGQHGSHVDEDLKTIALEVATIVRSVASIDPVQVHGSSTISRGRPSDDVQVRITSTSHRSKILVVEDDPLFRRAVINVFSDTDIIFIEAGSVAQAKKALDNDPEIQIILLDLELPPDKGTQILEHLVDRSSSYRIIILTGHEELLPSREAAIFNVFQYLIKSHKSSTIQLLRYAVDQALLDLEREKLEKENQESKFEDVILTQYPTPFAYIYQELKSDLFTWETLVRQKDIFQLLLNFSAVALMCEYFHRGVRDEKLETCIEKVFLQPSVDSWLNVIESFVDRNDNSQNSFADSFSTFFTSGSSRRTADLVVTFETNSSRLSEFEQQDLIRRCEKLLIPLLQDFQFITDYLLCHVSSVQKIQHEFKYRLRECTGANPHLLFSRKSFDFLMNSDELHLVNLRTNQFYSLHPFIILEYCFECKQSEIFFYAGAVDDQAQYVSYKTGHTLTADNVSEFRRLMRILP